MPAPGDTARTTFAARKPESAGAFAAPKLTTSPFTPENAVPLILAVVVAQDPAEEVVSPVSAGSCAHVADPERFANDGWALLTTPAAEMAVRKLLDAPVSATTVVPITPLAFLSCRRRSVES